MSWKSGGWRVNFIELPLRATSAVTPHLCFRCWVQVTGHEAVSWQIQGMQKVQGDLARRWCQSPHEGPGTLGSYLPVEVPGSADELVAGRVMIVSSRAGTPAVWRRVAFSRMASRLALIATRIWTFSCAHTSFLFWMRRSFLFWKRWIWESSSTSPLSFFHGLEPTGGARDSGGLPASNSPR